MQGSGRYNSVLAAAAQRKFRRIATSVTANLVIRTSEPSKAAWYNNCYVCSVPAMTTEHTTLIPGSTVRILYVSGSGATSERTITVGKRSVTRTGITYLGAYCHLRKEDRTFRVIPP